MLPLGGVIQRHPRRDERANISPSTVGGTAPKIHQRRLSLATAIPIHGLYSEHSLLHTQWVHLKYLEEPRSTCMLMNILDSGLTIFGACFTYLLPRVPSHIGLHGNERAVVLAVASHTKYRPEFMNRFVEAGGLFGGTGCGMSLTTALVAVVHRHRIRVEPNVGS